MFHDCAVLNCSLGADEVAVHWEGYIHEVSAVEGHVQETVLIHLQW